MKHNMKLRQAPFNMIKSGKKTIELRLYDEKRQTIKLGDVIEFSCTSDLCDIIRAEVIDLYVFDSFDTLYASLPLTECGYSEEEAANASAEDMEEYYTKEQQSKYGVVGIKISLLADV